MSVLVEPADLTAPASLELIGALNAELETGTRQHEAIGIYRRAGFIEIERFGEYVDSPLSLCMEKSLIT